MKEWIKIFFGAFVILGLPIAYELHRSWEVHRGIAVGGAVFGSLVLVLALIYLPLIVNWMKEDVIVDAIDDN